MITRKKWIVILAVAALALLTPWSATATDVDGGDDCIRTLIFDFGDAPEGIPPYPVSSPLVIGAFPTCMVPGPVGNQNLAPGCPAISTPPGPAGYVKHVQFGPPNNYWLGCYTDANGLPMGIDSELDGKVNSPPSGFSVCAQNPTDCIEPFEGGFDQDECLMDGSDAGLRMKVTFFVCQPVSFPYEVYNCGTVREIFLNILVDWNKDGDWNDSFLCPNGTCVYEWSVKNLSVTLLPGCNFLTTPPIIGGPVMGTNAWMRVTISDVAVTNDFPWAGSVTPVGDELDGGETEDYMVDIYDPTPTLPSTWGGIKALYR